MRIINCCFSEHAEAVQSIFNHTIAHSTALYEYQPRSINVIRDWFDEKFINNHPVIGAVNPQGELMGFASYGFFRGYPANQFTVEHCVYVHHNYQRQGVGIALMQQLIKIATCSQLHIMVGAIDTENTGSIILHEQLGFTHSGTLTHVGFKFNKWLDLAFFQRQL